MSRPILMSLMPPLGLHHPADLQRRGMPGNGDGLAKGNHGDGNQRHHQRQHGRKNEQALVDVVRQQVFFQDEFNAVSQRLQQAKRAHARWSPTVLDAANHFALQPCGIGHAREHDEDHQRDLNYSSDNKSFCIHGPYTVPPSAAANCQLPDANCSNPPSLLCPLARVYFRSHC